MNLILCLFISFWSIYYIIHIIIFGYNLYQENNLVKNQFVEEKELEDLILNV